MRPVLFLMVILLVAATAHASEQFPLGILGGRGEVAPGSPLLTIVSIDPDSPAARAELQAGDQIQGINGNPFVPHTNRLDDGGQGPQKALGEALDDVASRTGKEQRKITLDLVRGENTIQIEIELPLRPGLESEEGRRLLVTDASRQLLKTMTADGYWNSPVGLTGDRVLTAWALTALLSAGIEENRKAIDQAAAWLRGSDGKSWIPDDPMKKGPDNLGNWAISATHQSRRSRLRGYGPRTKSSSST